MSQGRTTRLIFFFMITLQIAMKGVPAFPISEDNKKDTAQSDPTSSLVGGSIGSLSDDINKKEAPRIEETDKLSNEAVINTSLAHQTSVTRNSRSQIDDFLQSTNPGDVKQNKQLIESTDLEAASSSYYRENDRVKSDFASNSFGELSNTQDESPKIIGVRVTSSVVVSRRNNRPLPNTNSQILANPHIPETLEARKIKSSETANKYNDDSPTTWRPSQYRPINPDYYKGVPSNRHTVSTLPGAIIGANPDYIQQQKERERKQEVLHPYQRAIIYRHQLKDVQRPRSFSYSSVINKFGDSTHTTANGWGSSPQVESAATEASTGFVTIINHHGGNNVVEHLKNDVEIGINLKHTLDNVDKNIPPVEAPINLPPSLPHVYSEPAKVYSEPAKVYSEPAKVYGTPEMIYSEPAKFYSEPAKNYGEPSKVYGEPSKVYGEPAKVYGEPSKVYGQPATVYPPSFVSDPHGHLSGEISATEPSISSDHRYKNMESNYGNIDHPSNLSEHLDKHTNHTNIVGHGRRPGELNYEVDESVSVVTNGRTHGIQEKPQDDGQKVGYVVEGRNYRKYRVEERTSDGFIVGEYGVVSHDDGSLRGVRYTADGTTNPRLIHDALMKFLSL